MSIELPPSCSSTDSLSAYELQRLENIKVLQNELGGVFLEVKQSVDDLAGSVELNRDASSEKNPQRWRRITGGKRPSKTFEVVRRSARIRHEKNSTSVSYNEQSDSDEDGDGNNKRKKFRRGSLLIKFPWFKNKENKEKDREFYSALNDSDFLTDDDEELDNFESSPKRRRRMNSAPVNQLPVSQITAKMIQNVHYSSSGKKYSQEGTTCHQCRQKTIDQKSYCRHKGCRGVRGMFCGFCLGKRYGEDVAVVLLEKKWACPPCRGYCNCSICRRRQGKSPTGQLASVAQANGFKSVRHLLVQTEGENAIALSDEDEDKENVTEVNADDTEKSNINETTNKQESNINETTNKPEGNINETTIEQEDTINETKNKQEGNKNEIKNKQEGVFEEIVIGEMQSSNVSNKEGKTEGMNCKESLGTKNEVSSEKSDSSLSDSSEEETCSLNPDLQCQETDDDVWFKQHILPLST